MEKQEHEQLEIEWAKWNGLNPAGMVACSSGTAALHLACEVFRYKRGAKDSLRIGIPDYTMIACPRAAVMAGLKPVLLGTNPETLQAVYRQEVLDTLDALMLVRVYGGANPEEEQKRLPGYVIEDLAEAHGDLISKQANAACWSFYRNKTIAGEEGGAVYFIDPEEAELARSLRCLGFGPVHDYRHIPRGMNYRLAPSLAKLIRFSLFQSEYIEIARTDAVHRWDAAFTRRGNWLQMGNVRIEKKCEYTPWWVYPLRLSVNCIPRLRDILVETVQKATGIAIRPGFTPIHLQEEFAQHPPEQVSNDYWQRIFYLPLMRTNTEPISDDEMKKVVDAISTVLASYTS